MPQPDHVSRRMFLEQSAAWGVGFAGLGLLARAGGAQPLAQAEGRSASVGFGELRRDPNGIIDLPAGFDYRVIARAGEEMVDGLLTPGRPDGMCALPGPDPDTCILICNHENEARWAQFSPFGRSGERLDRIDASLAYDVGGALPATGGTTTIVYDLKRRQARHQFLSLAGTLRNCAGGQTPWGSWISCEEDDTRAGERGSERDHGYAFEVPGYVEPGLTKATPIKAMGRFYREAVCVDPRTGIVYQTEDRDNGLIYRYTPKEPGNLLAGGATHVLGVVDRAGADMRNWPFLSDHARVPVGQSLPVRWIKLDDVDPRDDVLRMRGYMQGAARFARGEGMVWAQEHDGSPAAYFICTSGGQVGRGQVWRYRPGPHEGTPREADAPGMLELFAEPNDRAVIDMPDNVCVAPWGDLILCTDNEDRDYLAGVTPHGAFYRLALNRGSDSEFAGACFSPDGTTLFVNVQEDGLTLAITGPWDREVSR